MTSSPHSADPLAQFFQFLKDYHEFFVVFRDTETGNGGLRVRYRLHNQVVLNLCARR